MNIYHILMRFDISKVLSSKCSLTVKEWTY